MRHHSHLCVLKVDALLLRQECEASVPLPVREVNHVEGAPTPLLGSEPLINSLGRRGVVTHARVALPQREAFQDDALRSVVSHPVVEALAGAEHRRRC